MMPSTHQTSRDGVSGILTAAYLCRYLTLQTKGSQTINMVCL